MRATWKQGFQGGDSGNPRSLEWGPKPMSLVRGETPGVGVHKGKTM